MATASTARSWVLLEQPGPWGVQALGDSRLPEGLGARLAEQAADLGLRVLLIRRPGRGASSLQRHCFLASTVPGRAWVEHTRLDRPADVLDLDLAALARGERPGLDPVPDPLFLVCTHGRHDPCCAERGRPVALALAESFPTGTWESSHLGGDRFAANLLCFPDGLYFGRLSPSGAREAAAAYAGGELDLEHYRGRSAYPFPVQAAETFLRVETGRTGVDDVRFTGWRAVPAGGAGSEVTARFVVRPGKGYAVRLRVEAAAARLLSCHDGQPARPPAYRLLDIVPA